MIKFDELLNPVAKPLKIVLGILVVSSANLVTSSAFAADALEEVSVEERIAYQAVSDVNAKVEAAYVHMDLGSSVNPALNLGGDGHGYLLQGAVSMPVGQNFGLQIDAGTLNADLDQSDILARGVGGHLFWRDPSVGLIGAYGHYVEYDNDIEATRFGGELEWYGEAISIEAFAGVDHLDTPIGDNSYLAGEATIGWYATDNFRISLGVAHSFEQTKGVVGTEVLLNENNFAPALFANASFGEDETSVMAGFRVYLGKSKTLKARHREDDPAIGLFDNFGAIANCVSGNGGLSAAANSAKFAPSSSYSYSLDGCDVKRTSASRS